MPHTVIYSGVHSVSAFQFPIVLKPRTGSGSRGVSIIKNSLELPSHVEAGQWLAQEYLPGTEYSVDVLVADSNAMIAAVPRVRMKVDSGVAVTSRTVRDDELIDAATRVAKAIGLKYVANIQFKRDLNGAAALLEVNPRFPGTMPLTVAAGVNMPSLSLKYILGEKIEAISNFKEIAVVRYWQEQFVSTEEIQALTPPTFERSSKYPSSGYPAARSSTMAP